MFTPIGTSVPPIGLRPLQQTQQSLADSMQRLATGSAINAASDNPAGLMAGINLEAALRVLDAESRSIQRESSILATKDGALAPVGEMLSDLKGLAVQAANSGAMSDEEREALDLQAASIVRAIEYTTGASTFAGESLFEGRFSDDVGSVSVEEGSETTEYTLADVGRGLSLSGDAELISQIADQAIGDVATMRGEIGATIANELEPRARAIDTEFVNTASARSLIMDTNYASETASLVRLSALADASRASLVIGGRMSTAVLDLLSVTNRQQQ